MSSRSTIVARYDARTESTDIVIKLYDSDFEKVHLDETDRMIVLSDVTEPADLLQNLEIILRRARQQGLMP